MSSELRDILTELIRIIGYEFNKSTYEGEMKHIDKAEADIRLLLKEKLGEKKDIPESFGIPDKISVNMGYNLKTDEILKIIEKL